MDTYPCPACGGVADEEHGCRSCGRPHDPVAASLAQLNRRLAGLDQQSRRLADDQAGMHAQRARLQAEADALKATLVQQLTAELSGVSHVAAPPARTPTQRTATTEDVGITSAPPPLPPAGAGPETSPRSAQNTLLTLGGVLLGIAAIVFTALFYTTTATGGRAFILGVATMVALAAPLLLTRRTLTATAETIAGFGLLLVLLDGYAAYSADLAGIGSVSLTLFSAILFGLVAGVAAAYRLASHLRAPQFAALLAVQPFLPLIAADRQLGRDGFAAVFAIVAALNLASVELLSRDLSRAIARVRLPGAAPGPSGQAWPRMLRELAWVLFGATLAVSVALAATGLLRAGTVGGAIRSSLVLLLAAAVGVVGGHMSGRSNYAHIATGAAALAIIASVSRVNALALPQYTLVLTAAVAAAIALASQFLPERSRRGAALGSLLGAAMTALVVVATVVATTVATVRAAVTPAVWASDLTGYVQLAADWQVPAAAVLLTILAVAVAPPSWRLDAVVAGTFVTTLALPGTGVLAWWAVPLLASLVSTAATAAALFAQRARAALHRSGVAALLGIYAVTTSLARPELTAAVGAVLTLVCAGAALLTAGWPDRFGPYADRVADSAVGAAAFTLPLTIGTFAWIGGAPGSVLVPVTLLATAIGVLGAALSQVAAEAPRTASAGGAVAAAVGCVLLSTRAEGAELADIGLAVLLLAAATAAAASRAFEVAGTGRFATRRAAARVRVDGTVGEVVDGTRGRSRLPVDGTTAAAALAVGTLILAMARVAAVAVPGIGLVTTTAMVLVVALGVRAVPEAWRAGPRLGAGAVGGTIVIVTAGIAVMQAARAIVAATPFWAADLAGWSARVASVAPYGWQVPMSLLLAAAAAWALLPAPAGGDVAFVTLSLAGLSLPAVFGLAWWSPSLIAGVLAIVAGFGAALVGPAEAPGTHTRRLGLAGVLGLYAVAASGATAGSTALVLGAVVATGILVAATAHVRSTAPPSVAGVASAAALAAAPGAAATLAVTNGTTRIGVLGSALAVAAFGVVVVAGLRLSSVRWGSYPTFGVGAATLAVATAAAIPDPVAGQVWAAGSALVATAAASAYGLVPSVRPSTPDPPLSTMDPTLSTVDPTLTTVDLGLVAEAPERTGSNRGVAAVVMTTAVPAALLAAAASTPAWLTALVGPYRTLRQVWGGYAVAPTPSGAGPAVATLLLLALVAAGIALTLGGRRYLFAAVLPPLAAAALVLPAAVGAPRGLMPWVALAVALVTGLGAALSRPTRTTATTLLRGTAAIVCALTGGAGVAGSLATPGATLSALGIVLAAALVAAGLGQDPQARTVAWIVASAAGFALAPTALAAAGRELRPAAFGILAMCAGLVGIAWTLARTAPRRSEAAVVELCAALGATFALLLALDSARHTAAVLTIWGLLLGASALRRDRPARWRQWLVRAALAAELGACWMLLYAVQVGLTEAYTLPFAAVALLMGALELRRRRDLSSWVAYGPALAGGFLPSLALVLVGADPVWRWVSVFVAAVACVIVGSSRGRQAPAVTGTVVAMVVAVTEMIRLLAAGRIFGAVLVALAGVVLIVFGAISETRLRGVRRMS